MSFVKILREIQFRDESGELAVVAAAREHLNCYSSAAGDKLSWVVEKPWRFEDSVADVDSKSTGLTASSVSNFDFHSDCCSSAIESGCRRHEGWRLLLLSRQTQMARNILIHNKVF